MTTGSNPADCHLATHSAPNRRDGEDDEQDERAERVHRQQAEPEGHVVPSDQAVVPELRRLTGQHHSGRWCVGA